MPKRPLLLYASFDEVPGPKGAATHIEAFARSIGRRFGTLILVTPGPRDLPIREFAPGVRQIVLGCPDDNPIGRCMTFRARLMGLLRDQPFDLIHFRSIFEGYPPARRKERLGARLLYEVNGFPSIEMKYLHRNLIDDDALQAKLVNQEQVCLESADRVVTVSEVSRQQIVERGIESGKTRVIPNGVDVETFAYRDPPTPAGAPTRLLYVGTLTAYQGIETLLDAVHLVRAERPVELRLVGPTPKARMVELSPLVSRYGLSGAVSFLGPRDHAAVVALLHESHATVVPLLPVDRNTRQGCCPLKLLEAMAAGCPVIASDLPVVRELGDPDRHYLPARPGDARSLGGAVLRLAAEPGLGPSLARRARDHVVRHFTWEATTARLLDVYEELLGAPGPK